MPRASVWMIAFVSVVACGCAPAVPTLSGGGITPDERVDLGVGGAVRVPLGDLAPDATSAEVRPLVATDAPGGVAPVALGRMGVADGWDAGLLVAGPLMRAELRAGLALDADSSLRPGLVGALAPHVGLVRDDGADGTRVGVDLPLLFTLDATSLVGLWLGPRVGLSRVFGQVRSGMTNADASATVLRAGGVLGLAVGFRHLHALVELGADWERWDGDVGGADVSASGVALTPAFALRYRL